MKSFSASDAKNRFGQLLDLAQAEPVHPLVRKHRKRAIDERLPEIAVMIAALHLDAV